MGIYLSIVGKAVIYNMSKVINIKSSCSNICCNQKLKISDPEFLHNCIALSLRQITMKSIGIISVVNQF